MGVYEVMTVFFHKYKPQTVKAYSLEECPEPIEDWTTEKPDYTQLEEDSE